MRPVHRRQKASNHRAVAAHLARESDGDVNDVDRPCRHALCAGAHGDDVRHDASCVDARRVCAPDDDDLYASDTDDLSPYPDHLDPACPSLASPDRLL